MTITNFSFKWDTEVKELARKCVNNEFINLVFKGEHKNLTNEEQTQAEELAKNIKDPYGMFYISEMIWKVEHALADDREFIARLAIVNVLSVISRPSYWGNIFKYNYFTEEASNIKNLWFGLKDLSNL